MLKFFQTSIPRFSQQLLSRIFRRQPNEVFVQQMYRVLKKLDGIGQDIDRSMAHKSVDQILYGD